MSSVKIAFFLILALMGAVVNADQKVWSFNVLNQRSVSLTGQYWNPILKYVSEKSGVHLELKMAKTAPESAAMVGKGEFDFAYSNHIFSPANAPAGYRVIARPIEAAIEGQVVVLENSTLHSIRELDGHEVGFPSPSAFVGYAVPMDALVREGVAVKPVFAGNQEGIMGQLQVGRISAAGVNSKVMRDFAERENIKYRVLWTSESYLNIPISVHPRVPEGVASAVRTALVNMAKDPVGLKILESSASVIKLDPPYGFVGAEDKQYENYRRFYKTTVLKGL